MLASCIFISYANFRRSLKHYLIIKVHCLSRCLSSNSDILSHSLLFVNNFFIYFSKLFLFKRERRKRDLNPRAATNDLLPFQGSPFGQLGYFSKMPAYYTRYTFLTHSSFVVICLNLLSCACAPSRKTKGSPFNSELPKRRGWDSNPRALSDKRFSRPPRYDHFDTSPNFLSFHRLNCLVRPRDNVYSSIILSEMSTPFFHFFYFFVRWPLTLLS